jgi:peptidoglycan/xylan/chitin deacetylase (PgdA/CDA1 family)
MLRKAKVGILRFAEAAGLSQFIRDSAWRRQRLLILCYHGVSRQDEHEWNSDLYCTPETLRRRMELVVQERCNVLPLAQAVEQLRKGTLPPRAIAITFDDGFYDFYSTAFPILESFGFPVTLYLTTYYVEFNRPVFDPMCSYLLWRGRHKQTLEWPEVFPTPVKLDGAGRPAACAALREFALARKLSGQDKDRLLARLAERLGTDYEELCRKRVLHLVTPAEATELAARQVDIQYHTHRHRVYRSRERMFAELDDNRRRIMTYTSKPPQHFCYPSGFYQSEHVDYLAAYGITSATTCVRGLCSARTNPLLLPRLGDSMVYPDLEFRAWLAGTAALLVDPTLRIRGVAGSQVVD